MKYSCSICGFTYDEDEGYEIDGYPKGTKFEDIDETWTCPLCGASKSDFEAVAPINKVEKPVSKPNEKNESENTELSNKEVSLLLSNLAKGCEKQYLNKESENLLKLSEYFNSIALPSDKGDLNSLKEAVGNDIEFYNEAKTIAEENHDRGSLRALVWSEKVSKMISSSLNLFEKKGENLLSNGEKVYVCTICGFIYIGNNLPEVCPVCKVPNFKFEQVK